jgi:hypothetical protein
MDNLLVHRPAFTIGADGLVEGTILVTISLNFDFSYVDVGSL